MVRAILINSMSLLIIKFHENATTSRDLSAKIPGSCACDGWVDGQMDCNGAQCGGFNRRVSLDIQDCL